MRINIQEEKKIGKKSLSGSGVLEIFTFGRFILRILILIFFFCLPIRFFPLLFFRLYSKKIINIIIFIAFQFFFCWPSLCKFHFHFHFKFGVRFFFWLDDRLDFLRGWRGVNWGNWKLKYCLDGTVKSWVILLEEFYIVKGFNFEWILGSQNDIIKNTLIEQNLMIQRRA
jgi:hypothetical protein